MEGFLNEARTIANLKHPHIVRVLDFGVEKNIPYLVMEYAPLGTLRQRYPRGTRLPLTAVVSYVKQVASAGIVVYEWISGDRPFHGSFTEMYSQHLFVSPPPLYQKVPMLLHDVDAVIQTALAKDPQQRFPTVQAFAEALEQAVQKALPTVIVPPRGLPQPEQPSPVRELPQSSLDATVEATPHGQILANLIRRGTHPAKRTLSRRAILLGAVGLVVAGGTVTWLTFARKSSSGTAPDGFSHASPSTSHTPSPRSTTTVSQSIGYLFFTYQGHVASVGTVAWAPNGQRIASGSSDRTAKIWDASSGTTLVTFRGHAGAVQSVAWSPDGTYIASGSRDKTVQIWDAASGNTTVTYRNHVHQVNTALWSSDGVRIASSSNDDTVHLWDATSGNTKFIYRRHTNYVWSAAWSPDAKHIASACNDGTVQIWQAV